MKGDLSIYIGHFTTATQPGQDASPPICCDSDYASALNWGGTQCHFMSNRIGPSTEGHTFLIRIQNNISVAFGQPHLYKKFWFGGSRGLSAAANNALWS